MIFKSTQSSNTNLETAFLAKKLCEHGRSKLK